MKRTLLLTMLLLPSLALAQTGWTNCSNATMVNTAQSFSCDPATPPYDHYENINATSTFTYKDSCINLAYQNKVYYTANSTVTGHGQCQLNNQATMQWLYCPAVNDTVITLATSSTDYNRMYNYAHDYVYLGAVKNPDGVMIGGHCAPSGTWRQDMQQCSPIACSGGGGGGGGGGDTCLSCTCGSPSGVMAYCSPCCPSPIVIDTTGKGFKLTSAQAGVVFDIRANGRPIRVAWTSASSGNAFLALPNKDGVVTNGSQLFGNYTKQSCTGTERNGYCALAEWDKPENGGNGDGIIDWHDAIYPRLRLWRDDNHDGVSQSWELHTLPELGVYSIGLKYVKEPMVDAYGNGFRYRGVLNPNPLDGTSQDGRYTYDVFFTVDLNYGKNAGFGPLNEQCSLLKALQEEVAKQH